MTSLFQERLCFKIELSLDADSKRALVGKMDRVIVKKLAVKFDGIVIFDLNDFHMFACYRDQWKTDSEKKKAVRQGIIHSSECNEMRTA